MAVLYVDEQGAQIHRTGDRLIIRKDGAELRSVRMRDIERIALIGPIDFTTPAMHAEVADRRAEGRTSFRAMIRQQASRMRAAVLVQADYNPYTPR